MSLRCLSNRAKWRWPTRHKQRGKSWTTGIVRQCFQRSTELPAPQLDLNYSVTAGRPTVLWSQGSNLQNTSASVGPSIILSRLVRMHELCRCKQKARTASAEVRQAQQMLWSDLQARKAEYEASQLRILFSELRSSLDTHSRSILHAGEALEKLSGKLCSPDIISHASPGLADALMGLQADMYSQVDKLKSGLLHMMSIEL